MRLGTQVMFDVVEVKGEATEASSSDKEIPLWALFRAWVKRKLKNTQYETHVGLQIRVMLVWLYTRTSASYFEI